MSKQIIKLTDTAANRIKEIMANADNKTIGVRVGVKSGGCAGMSYSMEYAKDKKTNDEVIEDKGVKVFIDPAAIIYLLGTEMDYKKQEFSSQFVFNNPNETERCGCGRIFLKFKLLTVIHLKLNWMRYVQICKFLEILSQCMHQFDHQ